MTMPIDLIFVRHGHSEANEAMGKAKRGDASLITTDFRETPGHRWRLTEKGREQARIAGQWLRENLSEGFDRYYASPFVRTMDTAAHLALPGAEWRLDQRLRERDWGEINSVPPPEHQSKYPRNALIKKIDALYWRPPAGESIADVRLRVRNFFDTMHRECESQSVIIVTHGEFLSAARAALEYMSDEDWVRADDDPTFKIENTHIYHYSRRDPASGDVGKYLSSRRSVCPYKGIDSGWTEIERRRYSNEALLEQVEALRSTPLINTRTEDPHVYRKARNGAE